MAPTNGMSHERLFSHVNAHRLDSAERRAWLAPDEILDLLDITPGMSVADIGAGTGYFAIPIAERVGARGRVYAVDVQVEMLAHLRDRLPAGAPIELVQGSASRTALPDASQNIAFLANVWHEIDDRDAALTEAERVLLWGGRVAIVDWRPDCAPPPGPPVDHRVSRVELSEQLRRKGWRGIDLRNVGAYSYLTTALRPHLCCARA
jgi:ubiquinone/menaquinone biosynthesis C-methylase UbiE